MMNRALIAAALLMTAASAAPAEETTIKVGTARAISTGATYYAIAQGYFKDAGINLVLEEINSSADVMAMVAQNQYQLVEGGVSAGFFNAVDKGLPLTLVADRTSSPLYHNLMLRPELKDQIKDIKGLKGRVIATNGAGSISTYEIGKVLEAGGLTLADVELKVIPFTQMGIALKNGAVDAALLIPPFTYQVRDQGLGVMFIDPDDYQKPQPVALAVNILNTDWAKSHQEALRNYFVAYLKGVRAYCQAYHGGSTRREIIDLLVKNGTERRPEVLSEYPWQARDPNGRINVASVMDSQAWFVKNKFSATDLPADRLVDASYIDYAAQKLGPFVLENPASAAKGCR